jgi:hypothetical protein
MTRSTRRELVTRLSGTGRLADDLYLLAHHERTGRPHLQPRAIGLGLAGALLAELMLLGTICIRPEGFVVANHTPPGDESHDVTQEITRGCQVAYVANDPLLLACARALLVSRTSLHTPQGQVITLSRRGDAIIMTSPAGPPVPGQALVRTSPAVSASPRRQGRIPRD